MLSFLKRNSSPMQVIEDIDGALETILNVCTVNVKLLTHEERSSLMDEYSSLSDAHSRLDEGTRYTELVKVLDECKALKHRIQTTCNKHLEDGVRKVSPATSCATEVGSLSIESDVRTSQLSQGPVSHRSNSVANTGDSWHTATTGSRRQSIESGPHIASLDRFNSVTTNGDSWHTATTEVRRLSITSGPNTDTLSENSTIANRTDSTATTDDDNRNTPQMGTSVPTVTSNITPATSRISTKSAPSDTDCIVVDANSIVGSLTFNIDSDGATGATHMFHGNSPSRILPQSQQRLTPRVYQSHAACGVKRERVMYLGPGSEVGSPTFNIRSPNASGVVEQAAS